MRWAVAVFCAFGLAINYIDRSAISVSLPFMTQDFSLTPTEKGLILSAFSWSYALMQIPAGRLIDRFGERVMFGASVLVWSLFTAATAGVSSFAALLGLRLGLGVGEAGAYPAAAKTVSQWFPLRLRGRATSVYDSGARIGSAAATPIIALIIGLFGWRAAFIFAGGLGILWAIGWWAWYRRPENKAGVNEAELEIIHESHREQSSNNLNPDAKPMRIAELFKQRTVWGMMLGFFCLNFMITFFLTWFPSYLVEERGFSLLKLGAFGMIPPLAAILGSWAGGLIGDYLLQRGWSLNKVRKTCLVGGMLVCSVIALAAIAPRGLAGARADVDLVCGGGVHHRLHLVPARRRRRLQHGRQPGLDAELLLQHRQRTEPDRHRGALRCDRLVHGAAAAHRGDRRRRCAVLRPADQEGRADPPPRPRRRGCLNPSPR